MAESIDRVILRILGKDLDSVILSFDDTSGVPTKTVPAMSRKRRDKGYKRANAKFSCEANVDPIEDPAIPDWRALMLAGTRIDMVEEKLAGATTVRMVSWINGRITNVTGSASDGESTLKVSMMFLDRK